MPTPAPASAPLPTATLDTTLDHLWQPYTFTRDFQRAPRLVTGAQGMHYTTADGRRLLDAVAGLWCVNAGHGRAEITEAIQRQAAELDFAPLFQLGHPLAFRLARRLAALLPPGLGRVFFANSGSEAVDTALKVALAYHAARGEPERVRFVGRQRAYHGVGFGGMSVGGIENNRKAFLPQLFTQVDHLPHTHDLARNAFTRGQPAWGAHLADALEEIVRTRGAHTIAGVIVEPVMGSTGVLVPPAGYLERLRAICDRHGLLLIFDEVITGFGRLGDPFAAQHFGVMPDMICLAKGLTNGAVPMGAVAVHERLHGEIVARAGWGIEFFHGYTYSGHPLAAAAGLATLDVYEREGLLTRARTLAPRFEQLLHGLRGEPHVIDVRNIGLMGAVELAPRDGQPGARAYDLFTRAFHEEDLVLRITGDIIALTPSLIATEAHLDEIADRLRRLLRSIA
ncbi:MAG: aminotransferase class III-fold pyridoxal phosphate-dependent enzyme [Gemmatimonadales bacterium]|nr:aminotransferase class III-fold pyridoxal phosphate-dependent enzyme [Gemmatimonadales bacterium]